MLVAQFYRELKDRVKNNLVQTNQSTQLQSMIILAIRIDDRQHKQELEKRGTYTFNSRRYQNTQKPPKKDQYKMVPMELDATEKRNKTP